MGTSSSTSCWFIQVVMFFGSWECFRPCFRKWWHIHELSPYSPRACLALGCDIKGDLGWPPAIAVPPQVEVKGLCLRITSMYHNPELHIKSSTSRSLHCFTFKQDYWYFPEEVKLTEGMWNDLAWHKEQLLHTCSLNLSLRIITLERDLEII